MAGLIKSLNITDAILSGFTVYDNNTETGWVPGYETIIVRNVNRY